LTRTARVKTAERFPKTCPHRGRGFAVRRALFIFSKSRIAEKVKGKKDLTGSGVKDFNPVILYGVSLKLNALRIEPCAMGL
jgi:hypothetical protein